MQRLNRLNEFAEEWLTDNLREKQVGRWMPKFQRITDKFERKFDENECTHPLLQNRKRRAVGENDELRYDRENPQKGIKQITTGYRKWGDRYICKWKRLNNLEKICKCEIEDKWNDRLNKFLEILLCRIVRGCTPAF